MTLRPLMVVLVAALSLGACASPRLGHEWVLRGFGETCGQAAAFSAAARSNRESLDELDWSPFGAPERGWRIYAPAIAVEIGARCTPDSEEFASRLARWERIHGLVPDGRVGPMAFAYMKAAWQGRRPFIRIRAQGDCPGAADEAGLLAAPPLDSAAGKRVLLAPPALHALERMLAAARRDLRLESGDETLTVFSGYRSPQYDAARCEEEQNCQGVVRAECSAHRTGTALDLVLPPAPGYAVDATEPANRLFQTQSPAYRWLAVNASRYGFTNYVFEPWHWEWAGGERSPRNPL